MFRFAMNGVSVFGTAMALVATVLIVSLLALEVFSGMENPYLGMFVYFAFPALLIFGLLLIPLGAWRVRNRLRQHPELGIPPLPRIDLNDPHTLRLTLFFTVATVFLLLLVGVAAVGGFQYTESTSFCGELCHTVMEPEHTAWRNSPHARVRCVECHVGPGAAWYVKAKLSGLRQVWVVLTRSWPSPIPTPIENLRPSRETCEQCHWPEKFYAGRQKVFTHYGTNEENNRREIDLMLRVGAPVAGGGNRGIHWHIGQEVSYIPGDRKRLTIPYVAVRGRDGTLTEYIDPSRPLARKEIARARKRVMDCTDCHNRPSHIYNPPQDELDRHLAARTIDPALPFIKKVTVDLLEKPYATAGQADVALDAGIRGYYARNYPELVKRKGAAIATAVEHAREIYRRTYFPAMKVSWRTYPNHIGHFYSPGCFRCHDGRHRSSGGRVISKKCVNCHIVLGQIQENVPVGTAVTEFVHPVDIGDELFTTTCSDCHAPGE
jgi:nitrate/TMAO reductase-like tetraheme cytochrome c subunit